jgi:hypothetical protein
MEKKKIPYEKPMIKELGTFKELTQRTTQTSKNGAKNDGKGIPATRA